MTEPTSIADKRKKVIMVVDGNAKDALTTSLVLQNFGYSVTTMKTAEEALEFLSIAVPSLVIIEFILPGMNGTALLDHMRADPLYSKVPVIVQTSHPDPGTQDRCMEAGCVLYLRKPVSGEDLFRAVQSVVERTPRKNVRVPAFLRASVDGAGTGAEFVTMLSEGGLFVKTLHPRPLGSKHTVAFLIGKKIVKADAQVLYAYGFGEGPGKEPGMGMRFLNIDAEDQALIRAFIAETFTAGTPTPQSP